MFIIKILKYFIIMVIIVFLILTIYGVYKGMKEKNKVAFFNQYYDYLKTAKTIFATEKSTEKELIEKGFYLHKNEWSEFDFNTINEETPAIIFSGLKKANAIRKYGFSFIYPFDGEVGFIGGSNIKEQEESCFTQKVHNFRCKYKNETAYIFKTIDLGKTFTKQNLKTNGSVNNIIKFNQKYFAIIEPYRGEGRTVISEDKGESWKLFKPFSIELFWDIDRFIYSKSKEINRRKYYDYFYTKDGGKTSQLLPQRMIDYAKDSMYNYPKKIFNLDGNRLVFLINNKLIFIDIDTLKKEQVELDIPKEKQIVNRDNIIGYYNNKKKEIYLTLEKQGVPYRNKIQKSLWFAKDKKLVELVSHLDKPLKFHVDGDYIGGLTRHNGLLVHIWTYDKGDRWNFELLPHYFWNRFNNGMTGYNQLWFSSFVKKKNGIKDDSYFIIGKIILPQKGEK